MKNKKSKRSIYTLQIQLITVGLKFERKFPLDFLTNNTKKRMNIYQYWTYYSIFVFIMRYIISDYYFLT